MVLYMLKTIMRVSNFFGMAEYNRLDEGCSENLTTSLILFLCNFYDLLELKFRTFDFLLF